MSAAEKLAIHHIHEKYMTHERRKTYIACEEMDFTWCESEVREFDRMWDGGLGIEDIAKSFGRDTDEVAVLAIDRARQGKIGPRKYGVFGRRRR